MTAPVKLHAGSLDMTAGTLTPGSMSAAIDTALAALVPFGVNEDPRGRRKLALAIAQGVIDHLVANHAAFTVTVPVVTTTTTREQPVSIVKE
jgi:hypothetical protein